MLANIPLCSIIIIVLILIFAIIHLGVSIGIIARNRQYKDIFRPEIGLSSFNIVISCLGFVVSILGLVCLLASHRILSKFLYFLTIDITTTHRIIQQMHDRQKYLRSILKDSYTKELSSLYSFSVLLLIIISLFVR